MQQGPKGGGGDYTSVARYSISRSLKDSSQPNCNVMYVGKCCPVYCALSAIHGASSINLLWFISQRRRLLAVGCWLLAVRVIMLHRGILQYARSLIQFHS
jgi:hypothetical protein